MKILQITPVFYPACKRGGIVTAVYNLSKELVRRGHDITVYTTDSFDGDTRINDAYLKIKDIKIYYFSNLSNSLAWNNIFFPIEMFLQIIQNSNNFDIIHLQDYRFFPHVVAYMSSKFYGVPYIFQPRYSYTTFFQKGFLKKIFDITFGHRMLKNASMLIAQLPSEAKEYEQLGIRKEKIAVIPNGFDMYEMFEIPERGIFRAKYAISDTSKIVLYLGRIDRIKGADLLIRSFANITKSIGNSLLIIVGPDSGYLHRIKELIKELDLEDKVLLLGPLFKKEKFEAYMDADVYVMPSMYEGLSIAPLEAYACNIPIVITDRCGTAQWMGDEFEFIIPYDEEQMTKSIIMLLNNESSLRYSESERMRRLDLLNERFSWGQIGEQTENVYYKTLNLNRKTDSTSKICTR